MRLKVPESDRLFAARNSAASRLDSTPELRSPMSAAKVRIINPQVNGASFTSPRRAARLVSQGHARWCGSSAIQIVNPIRDVGYDQAANAGLCSAREMQQVPIVMPRKLLAPIGRMPQPRAPRLARRTVVQDGVLQ